jgi:hypothetical protein
MTEINLPSIVKVEISEWEKTHNIPKGIMLAVFKDWYIKTLEFNTPEESPFYESADTTSEWNSTLDDLKNYIASLYR